MRNIPLILSLFLVLGACGGNDDTDAITNTFDPCQPLALRPADDSTPEEISGVIEGVALWNDIATTRLKLADGSGDAPEIAIIFQKAPSNYFGIYEESVTAIYINRNLTDASARAITVAHELGHTFGLVHVSPKERLSVMNAANITVLPSEMDVAAISTLWAECGLRE